MNQIMNELSEFEKQFKEAYKNCSHQLCEQIILSSMQKFPHSAAPHNWMGIFLEKNGDHELAMKHFRAAYSLDPSYTPARWNLEKFGTYRSHLITAFDNGDCDVKTRNLYEIENIHGIKTIRKGKKLDTIK